MNNPENIAKSIAINFMLYQKQKPELDYEECFDQWAASAEGKELIGRINLEQEGVDYSIRPIPTEVREKIIKEAWQVWEEDQKTNPDNVNPHAFAYGYLCCKVKTTQPLQEGIKEAKEFAEFIKNGSYISLPQWDGWMGDKVAGVRQWFSTNELYNLFKKNSKQQSALV